MKELRNEIVIGLFSINQGMKTLFGDGEAVIALLICENEIDKSP